MPLPPYSSSTVTPSTPSSPSRGHKPAGKRSLRSVSAASGAISRCAKARTASRNDSMSVAYGLYGTPSHHAFCDALTALEAGHRSWALPSGLAACTIAILAYVRQGDHVLVPDSVYSPTRRFCRDTLARYGIETSFYAPRIGADIERQFRPTTRLLFMESPGSLTFEVQDLPLLAQIARRHGAVSVVDNTWA